MENLATILSAISSSKNTLDQVAKPIQNFSTIIRASLSFTRQSSQVNEEIESTIQQTREIDSEMVKCLEVEKSLLLREAELTKMASVTEFEIHSLTQVTIVASSSLELLKKEVDCLRTNRDDIVERMSASRETFIMQCQSFQRDISKEENGAQMMLLKEKDSLEKELSELYTKISSLKSSTTFYLEEVLEGLHKSNTMLQVDLQCGTKENNRLLRDIEHLKDSILALRSSASSDSHTVRSPKRQKYNYME